MCPTIHKYYNHPSVHTISHHFSAFLTECAYVQQVEKTEKLAREYGEKVKHNPTHAIAKTFAIHPGHMNPIFRPKWNQFFHLVSVRCGEKLIS